MIQWIYHFFQMKVKIMTLLISTHIISVYYPQNARPYRYITSIIYIAPSDFSTGTIIQSANRKRIPKPFNHVLIMSQITIQPISSNQLGQIHALILDCDFTFLSHALGFIPTVDYLQQQTLDDPDFDPELFLGAFRGNRLTGAVFGVRRPWKNGQEDIGFIKYILVKKDNRRMGTGTRLLAVCESRLLKRGAGSLIYGASSPRYFFPGVPTESKGLCGLLESAGWDKQSERVSLFTYLDKTTVTRELLEKVIQEKDAFRLSLATYEDEQEVKDFVTGEFTVSWAQEACAAIHNTPAGFCSVLRDKESNTVIGFAAVNGTNPNWFGPMGVRSELRKQGLGHLLVYHTFLTAKQRGMKHLLIPWINGKETFYSRFVTEPRWQRYYKYEKQV